MKITAISLVILFFTGSAIAQTSGFIEPGNSGYVLNSKSSKWTLEMETEPSSDPLDPPAGSRIKIVQKTGSKSVIRSSFVIAEYYNSTGVAYVEMDQLDSPLFLVQLFSSAEQQGHEHVFLVSPDCKKKPLFEALNVIGESINQLEIRPSATDVSISYTDEDRKQRVTKTWTHAEIKRELSSSSCR